MLITSQYISVSKSTHCIQCVVVYQICCIQMCIQLPGGSDSKESACNAGDLGLIAGSENPLEKGMATHSSILAWRIQGWRSLVSYSPWSCRGKHN